MLQKPQELVHITYLRELNRNREKERVLLFLGYIRVMRGIIISLILVRLEVQRKKYTKMV